MEQRKYPLDKIACFQTVAAKAGKILYHDTVNPISPYQVKQFLHRRALEVCPAVPVIYKFRKFRISIFRQFRGIFPKDVSLAGNTHTVCFGVLQRETDVKSNPVLLHSASASLNASNSARNVNFTSTCLSG